MNITPSKFQILKGMDILLFWIAMWGIPTAAIIAYNTVFIGPGVLKPIPEGYEPREEEYERYPITRWLVKHLWMSEQQQHELQMAIEHQQVMHNRQKHLMTEVHMIYIPTYLNFKPKHLNSKF